MTSGVRVVAEHDRKANKDARREANVQTVLVGKGFTRSTGTCRRSRQCPERRRDAVQTGCRPDHQSAIARTKTRMSGLGNVRVSLATTAIGPSTTAAAVLAGYGRGKA